MTREELKEVVARAERNIAERPEWKQNILARSDKPTCEPRKIVDNINRCDRCDRCGH